MVGHQTVGVDTTAQLLFPFPQIIEGVLIIVVIRKHHLRIMPPVNHMMREVRENDSGGTGMAQQDSRNEPKNKSVPFFSVQTGYKQKPGGSLKAPPGLGCSCHTPTSRKAAVKLVKMVLGGRTHQFDNRGTSRPP